MQSLDTIHDYLRTHSEEIGKRILASYPALHGTDEAPSPLLSSANPCDHGREQALAIGVHCFRMIFTPSSVVCFNRMRRRLDLSI
jgi:hypothetical protein